MIRVEEKLNEEPFSLHSDANFAVVQTQPGIYLNEKCVHFCAPQNGDVCNSMKLKFVSS